MLVKVVYIRALDIFIKMKKKYFTEEERKKAIRISLLANREKYNARRRYLYKTDKAIREQRLAHNKKFYDNNPEIIKSRTKISRRKHYLKNQNIIKEKAKERMRIFRVNNPEKAKEISRANYKLKMKDPAKKIKARISNRIHKWLKTKGERKHNTTQILLGCSKEFLRIYIEKQFYDHPISGKKMTWKNYTHKGWHIDHKIPLSKFNMLNKEEINKACHYSNLQPMWAEENLAKAGSNKLKS